LAKSRVSPGRRGSRQQSSSCIFDTPPPCPHILIWRQKKNFQNTKLNICQSILILIIIIHSIYRSTSVADPVLFWPLDPVSGMGQIRDRGMNIPDPILRPYYQFLGKNIWILWCGSGSRILLTLDPCPGWIKSDPASWIKINIPDRKHREVHYIFAEERWDWNWTVTEPFWRKCWTIVPTKNAYCSFWKSRTIFLKTPGVGFVSGISDTDPDTAPQRVLNDLQRTRHSCVRMIWLLAPHPPPSPPLPSVSQTGDTQDDWERETSCWRERREGDRRGAEL